VAAFAFEKKLHALAPALPANRADISCQVALLEKKLSAFSHQLSAKRSMRRPLKPDKFFFTFYLLKVRFTAMAGLRPASSHQLSAVSLV
jgi:hypothetical protein